MKRSDLIRNVAENEDMSSETASEAVDAFFSTIERHLAAGGRVELRGFAAFWTAPIDRHSWHDPRTLQKVSRSGKGLALRFRPSRKLREVVNGNKPTSNN